MPYQYKTHFPNGSYPLCGHPCWSGSSPISVRIPEINCKRCLHILGLSRLPSRDELWKLVLGFFNGDKAKTDLWFETVNPLLGGVSPVEMIQLGRYDKVLKWAKAQIAENSAPGEAK